MQCGTYSLIVRYVSKDWLFIEDGESLVLLIDGERVGFTGSGSSSNRMVLTGGYVFEESFYFVSADDIRRIAQAKSVSVKIVGSSGYIKREFSEKNLQRFREFVYQICAIIVPPTYQNLAGRPTRFDLHIKVGLPSLIDIRRTQNPQYNQVKLW